MRTITRKKFILNEKALLRTLGMFPVTTTVVVKLFLNISPMMVLEYMKYAPHASWMIVLNRNT